MASKEIDKARAQATREKKRNAFTKQRLAATRKQVERERFDREFARIVNAETPTDSRLAGRREAFRAARADRRVDRPKRSQAPPRYANKPETRARRRMARSGDLPPPAPLHDSLI